MTSILSLIIYCLSFIQPQNNEVTLQVYNKSKSDLSHFTIKIDSTLYSFGDIKKNKKSEVIHLPELWSSGNNVQFGYIKKRPFKKNLKLVTYISAIDHIGDKKYKDGNFVMTIYSEKIGKGLYSFYSIVSVKE